MRNIHSALLQVRFLRRPRIFHLPFACRCQKQAFETRRDRFPAMTKLVLILTSRVGSLPAEVCHMWILAQALLRPF